MTRLWDWLPATRGQVRELWEAMVDQTEAMTAALERIKQDRAEQADDDPVTG